MGAIHVRLFGHFSAERDARPLDALRAPRVQELFCYLLLKHAGQAREALAGRLWPDEEAAVARKALRQALWQLQRALDEAEPPILLVHADTIAVNEATVWLDTARLDAAADVVRDAPGAQLGVEQAQAVRDAVALYRGDMLEGWFQDWCIFERERLTNVYLSLVNKLMGYCEATRRYEEGLEFGSRILRVDPARERAHWRMMRLQYLLGDRVGAIRQYQRCVAALREELGVEPSARTQALYEHIRSDSAAVGAAPLRLGRHPARHVGSPTRRRRRRDVPATPAPYNATAASAARR